MKDFKPPIATDAGLKAQLAYFSVNKPIVLTKMAIGSGRLSDFSVIPQMTALVREEKTLPITEFILDDENPLVTVCGVVDYMEVASPFEVCELGLFIIDPVTDAEVLYCYSYTERSELAPARLHASELISITTLISRTQEITIPEYTRIPYVLRHEITALKTVVSTDMPDEAVGLWYKPLGKINGWDEWGDIVIGGSVNQTQPIYLSGVHFGEEPPASGDVLWIKPKD